ncbi:hypothetical protein GQ44DRAFT_705947 [Phaeosphaeriaceae sp. PMI808]|nr:hypothetical protein GQ44DRAFT_705947 [Phaeosphaeriaceae sp. PMI808]
MISGDFQDPDAIMAAMGSGRLNLTGINSRYDDLRKAGVKTRKTCDLCALMPIQTLKRFGAVGCKEAVYQDRVCCEICEVFGRYCCSRTVEKYIGKLDGYTTAVLAGTQARPVHLNMDIFKKHKAVAAAMVYQPRWDMESNQELQDFENNFLRIDSITSMEDSFSDDEGEDEEVIQDSDDEVED